MEKEVKCTHEWVQTGYYRESSHLVIRIYKCRSCDREMTEKIRDLERPEYVKCEKCGG